MLLFRLGAIWALKFTLQWLLHFQTFMKIHIRIDLVLSDPLVFYKVCLLLLLKLVASIVLVSLSHIRWLRDYTFASEVLLLILHIISCVNHRIWGMRLLLRILSVLVTSYICQLLILDQVHVNFYILFLMVKGRLTCLVVDVKLILLLLSNEVLQNLWPAVKKALRDNYLMRLENLEMAWRVQ